MTSRVGLTNRSGSCPNLPENSPSKPPPIAYGVSAASFATRLRRSRAASIRLNQGHEVLQRLCKAIARGSIRRWCVSISTRPASLRLY